MRFVAAGCGALCPSYRRGCYGCFGPQESANTSSLAAWIGDHAGLSFVDKIRLFRGINAYSEAFRRESEHHER